MARIQFCTFLVDGFSFGIRVDRVHEVIRYQDTTRVPLADPVVHGLINLRGQIVTVIDLRTRLGLRARSEEDRPTNIVIDEEGAAVSLLVDRIGDVVEVDDQSFERPPETVTGVARTLITGAYKLEGHLLLVLDVDRAISVGEAA